MKNILLANSNLIKKFLTMRDLVYRFIQQTTKVKKMVKASTLK